MARTKTRSIVTTLAFPCRTRASAVATTDYQVNLKNEVNIETLLRELGELRAERNTRLSKLEE